MEQGVHAVYQIPMAYYENKELIDELKKYILSKNSQGIESKIAFGLKTNLIESKFQIAISKNLLILFDSFSLY